MVNLIGIFTKVNILFLRREQKTKSCTFEKLHNKILTNQKRSNPILAVN